MLVGLNGDIAMSEIQFSNAMVLLRNYSLVVQIQKTISYAMHPVLHKWAFPSQGKKFASPLRPLAVVVVGHAFRYRLLRSTQRYIADFFHMPRRVLDRFPALHKSQPAATSGT
jgi:hypothetical protein